MSERVAVAALVCDGTIGFTATTGGNVNPVRAPKRIACAAECSASAPIRGDGPVELEQAHRAARLAAVKLAESLGWDVSASGKPVRDLCPRCKAATK